MGNLNQTLKCLCTTLFSLFLFFSHSVSSSSSSSSTQIQPQDDAFSRVPIPANYRVFHLRNTNAVFQERLKKSNKKKGKRQRKKMMNKSSPFSVMLPKGFVPPSGSSPCHNKYPTSVSFHCRLSASQP